MSEERPPAQGQTDEAKPPTPDPTGKTSPVPRWLINACGHVLAAVLGLLLGYLILRIFRPDALPW